MSRVHATAVVAPEAKLGPDVQVGPFCVIGPNVEFGPGVVLHSHVVVTGHTRVGAGCTIFPFASIGHPPQDLKYKGEPTRLEIGEQTCIREHVTINPGTVGGPGVTRIGRNCTLMIGAHVAHDCQVGDNVVMANNATLAGHVMVGERAFIGGLAAVLQFVRIGNNAMIGGMAGIAQDVVPFGMATGKRATLQGLNLVGLRRANLPREQVDALREAYDRLFCEGEEALEERAQRMADQATQNPLIGRLVSFIGARSKHGILQPLAEERPVVLDLGDGR